MATTIKLKNSVTTTNAPSSLVQGEVAINVTDKKVWVGNAATTPIQIVGAGTTGTAAGSNTQVQYNSSGSFAGDADFTFNGTTVTMANDASISGLTVGKGGGAVSSNTAFGVNALTANQAGGTNNTAIGNAALDSNTTGDANTALGQDALQANTTASNNTAVGYQALYTGVTAERNTAVGRGALYASTGSYNTAVGDLALNGNTTGTQNASFAIGSLQNNTTGSYNVAFGGDALKANTTASNNTAVGYQAGYGVTTGPNIVAVGYQASYALTTGGYSTAIGYGALSSNTTSNGNVAVGYRAGQSVVAGDGNTLIGSSAGYLITTGAKNTILGQYTGNNGGLDIRTASNYIVLSDGDGNPRQIINGSTGAVFIGKTAAGIANTGFEIDSAGGALLLTRSNANPMAINRLGNDGILIDFYQDSNQEGTISVSGTTVSYNGGHLARWSQLPDNSKDDTILKGTVLTNLDDMCVWNKDGTALENEQLNKMKVSDVEGDTNVAGVFVNWTRDEDCNSDDMNIAMTGDMIIRIADGVVVQKGDLLMSAGDGTAKPQGDDIVRSKTIAKVTSNYVTCTYADGSYCVPCVLMAC